MEGRGYYSDKYELEGGPSRVIIMRHAEKDVNSGVHLNGRGKIRAEQLSKFLEENLKGIRLNADSIVLFAAANKKKSHRPLETLEPLAKKCGCTINTDYKTKEYRDLYNHILQDPNLKNKTVIISWRHTKIVKVIQIFGIDDTTLSKYFKDSIEEYPDVYDAVWEITYPSHSTTTTTSTTTTNENHDTTNSNFKQHSPEQTKPILKRIQHDLINAKLRNEL